MVRRKHTSHTLSGPLCRTFAIIPEKTTYWPLDDVKELLTTMTREINDLPTTARAEVASIDMYNFLGLSLICLRHAAH